MIDFHTHILPNIDDGAKNLSFSAKMMDLEIIDGVTTIFLTPHIFYSKDFFLTCKKVKQTFDCFCQKFQGKKVEFLLGGEIFYTDILFDALHHKQLITLNQSRYILLEFNLHYELENVDNALDDLLANGFIPILAHPERYDYFTISRLEELKSRGILFQLDASSFFGDFGKKAKKLSHQLMAKDCVDIIASDCHSIEKRGPNLKKAWTYVSKKFGDTMARRIFETNANHLLQKIKESAKTVPLS